MATLMAKHKRHPMYRDSRVEWLGDMPAHWEVRRIKWVAHLNPSKTEQHAYLAADTPVTFLPMEKVGTEGQIDTSEMVEASQVWNGYTYFRRGDILVAKITPCFENGKGAYLDSLPTEVGFGSTEFHVLRAKPTVTPQFLYRLTTDCAFRQNGTESMTGAAGQQRVPADFVANYQIPLPPLAEQRAIAAFLDRETAKINALVSKKERLIELLQEKRTALISRAVTKGLNPNAPLKESGIEWLGEIPAHWEVKRLKHLGSLQGGAGFPHEEQWDTTQEYPFFKVGDMGVDANQREMIKYQHTVSLDTASRLGAYVFPPSTIVFAKVGAALMLNRRRMIIRPSCIDNNMMGFIPRVPDPDWMMYWLSGLDLKKLANPGAVPSVNEGQMREQETILPPLTEQRTIAAFLDRETEKIDSLITKVHEAVELLTEKRTALISAAVTGQIDVREEMECT